MKKLMLSVVALCAFASFASCYDRPVTFEQLPLAAQTYIKAYFPEDNVTVALVDDDVVRPDYDVRLASGTELEFDHSGALKKISSRDGIPSELIPAAIRNYVSAYYPNTGYLEYEVDNRFYEVKLNNQLELRFNSKFRVMEIDD